MSEYLAILRRYRKSSIQKVGLATVWRAFKSIGGNASSDRSNKIIRAFGPRVILLASAVCNEHRNQEVDTDCFIRLCFDYLGIKESINDPEFLRDEAEELAKCIKSDIEKPVITDEKDLLHVYREVFLCRTMRMQHHSHLNDMRELYRAYSIYKHINKKSNNMFEAMCMRIFSINSIHFLDH